MRWSLWGLWLAVLITGCGQRPDSKIIEGHWVAEAFRVESVSLPIGPDLYITQNQLGLGTGTAPVKLRGIIAEGKEVALQTEVGLNIMFTFENKDGVWGVTEQEMHLSPLPAIISTIFPRFNLNMAMPRICLATNII